MKKTVLLTLLFSMLLFIVPVFADDEYTSSLDGTTETHNKEMIVIDVHINGTDIDNVKGDVNYSSNDLAVFSVEKNADLSDWDIEFNTKESTRISFNATSSGEKINDDTILFTIKFVVFNERTTFTNVTTTNVQSVMKTVEQIVVNQDEIDKALDEKNNAFSEEIADKIVVPDPIYKEQINEYVQTFTNANIDINVTPKVSENNYLKSVEVKNGTLTPSFNKLTNSYRIIADNSKSQISITALAELDSSSVEIGKEINGQIVVTVTAEDDSVNSYIFTIERTNVNPAVDPSTPGTKNPNGFNAMTIALLAGLAVVALGFIGIGGYYVYQGSRE